MRKAKKLIALFLCTVMFVSVFAGCNKNDTAISDTFSTNFVLDSSMVDETLSSETDSNIVDKTSSENTTKANSQKNNISSEKVVSDESNNQVDNSTKHNVSNNTTSSNNTVNKLPLTVNWVTTPKYTFDNIKSTLDGKAWIATTKNSTNSKLIDEKGNQLYESDTMEQTSTYTDIIVVKKGSQYGMITTSGKVLIALQQYEIGFSGGHILKRGSDGLAHILDKNGNDTGETTIWIGWSGSSGGGSPIFYVYDASTDSFYDTNWGVYENEDDDGNRYMVGGTLSKIDTNTLPRMFAGYVADSFGEIINSNSLGNSYKLEGYKAIGVFINAELKSKIFYDSIKTISVGADLEKSLFLAGNRVNSEEIDNYTIKEYYIINVFGEKLLNETFEDALSIENHNYIPVKQNGKWGFIGIPTL